MVMCANLSSIFFAISQPPSLMCVCAGSNVQGIQTTAVFDRATDEFIINTPNEGAVKWWIGNAACHGKFASVFARLQLQSESSTGLDDYGVHAFIVPIRSGPCSELQSHPVASLALYLFICGLQVFGGSFPDARSGDP